MDQSAKPAVHGSGATLPEAANGLSRVQHGYRTTRRVNINRIPGQAPHQRKLTNLEVPASEGRIESPIMGPDRFSSGWESASTGWLRRSAFRPALSMTSFMEADGLAPTRRCDFPGIRDERWIVVEPSRPL
jgi:hypothetical protein